MELTNFQENHTLVTDINDDPFALDRVKYPSFLIVPETTQYEVFVIDASGTVNIDQKVVKLKSELRARFVKLVPPSSPPNL